MENNLSEIINNLALKIANLEIQNAALTAELKSIQEQETNENNETETA